MQSRSNCPKVLTKFHPNQVEIPNGPTAIFAVANLALAHVLGKIFPSICCVFGRAHKKRSKKPDGESRERRARRRCSPFGSACRGAFAAADPSRRAHCEPDNSQSCIWKSRRVCWFRALICCCIIIFRDKCSSRVQWLHLVMVCLWVNGMDTAWMEDVVSGILELRFCEQLGGPRTLNLHRPVLKRTISSRFLIWLSLFLLNRGV